MGLAAAFETEKAQAITGFDQDPESTKHATTTRYEKEAYEHHHHHASNTSDDYPEPKQSTAVARNDDAEPVNDLEALPTNQSAGPPYSVFTLKEKRAIIVLTSCAGFFSPISASIYFPALNAIAADLHVSNSLVNLTLTSYMIFQGIAPTFFGDLADVAGRRPAYLIGFVIYIGACVGIALQNSFAALFILRCLQSAGSSGTIALGSGVVADVSTHAERGTYMGWATAGMLVGPAIAPTIGGLLAQFLGWRSIFWFLVILVSVFLVPFSIFFPETSRNVVGNGSIPPQGWNMSLINYLAARKAAKLAAQNEIDELTRTATRESARSAREELAAKRKLRFPNPWHTLKVIFEKDIGLLLLYNSLVYTAFYDINASTPYLFAQIYGFNDLQIGLCYIPFGVGSFLAPVINGRVLDWNFRRVARQYGIAVDKKRATELKDFPLEQARITVALPLVLVGAAAMLVYGWVLQAETSLAVPLVLQFIIGICLTGSFNVMSVMLVDNYPSSPSTATAANNFVRCLMGAAGTAIIIEMINGMGRGWCFTFIGLVVLAASPILWVLMRWGPGWREERRVRNESRKAEVDRHAS